jgi:hypothetical protein
MLTKYNNTKNLRVAAAYTGKNVEDYLVPYGREYDFDNRKEVSYYLPIINGVIDSISEPIFANDITREYDENSTTGQIYSEFIKDVDKEGTTIDEFIKKAYKQYSLQGNGYIIMDNYEEFSPTLREQLDNRELPWLKFKKQEELYEYSLDDDNLLVEIVFKNGYYYDGKGIKHEKYIGYTNEKYYEFYFKDSNKEIIKEKENSIGIIPIIRLDSNIDDHPKAYDAANTNIAIYNQLSESRDNERSSAFAMLQYPTRDDPDLIEIGNKNVITIDPESSATASYVSPDSAILSTMRESAKETIEFLRLIADQMGAVVIDRSSTKSGAAYAFEFLGTQYTLKNGARYCTKLEDKIVILLSLFIGDLSVEITYDKNFTDPMVDINADLDLYKKAQDAGIEFTEEETAAMKEKVLQSLDI